MGSFSNVLSSLPIAEGRTAEIYSWDDEHILKLYRDWCPQDWVEYEARIARIIYGAGIPSPAVGEIVELDGRRGLIYQRLEGVSMVQDLKERPWTLFQHARSLAELQFEFHEKSTIGLPSYKDRLRYDIDETPLLTEGLRMQVLDLLERLPDDPNICHGDFHPENILITKSGPRVIDWMNACTGSPWADVARTNLILTIGVKAASKQIPLFLRILVRLYRGSYLRRYRALRASTENEMHRWMPLISAARLNENIARERDVLIEMVRESFPK